MIGTNNILVLNIVSLYKVLYRRIFMANMMKEMFSKEREQCEMNCHYNTVFILVFSLKIQKIQMGNGSVRTQRKRIVFSLFLLGT